MGKSERSLFAGIFLLVTGGILFVGRQMASDGGVTSGAAASAENHSPSGPEKHNVPQRNGPSGEKKDQYYYPSSGRRTVSDEVRGLLSADGGLTDRAAIYFGLNDEKRSQVNALIRSKLEEESSRIAKRAVQVSPTQDDANTPMVWEIYALKDRGREFWEGLYRDLPALVGASHVEAFVAAMNDRAYGGFGRLDGRIKILSKEGEGQVQVDWSDPVSGTAAGGGTMNFKEFDARYGSAFRHEHAAAFSASLEQ